VLRPVAGGRERRRALADARGELRAGHRLVDQAPLGRAPSLHALGRGREEVGAVTPDLPFVDDAREATGAGQHAEERHLRERHRRRAVVDQQDLVAGERQLVAAARRGAVQGRERADA